MHGQLFVSRGARSAAIAPIGLLKVADLVFARSDGIDVFFNNGSGTLGLGDVGRPVIALVGTPQVTIEVESAYQDAGATVTDDRDGALTPAVDNPVNPLVIGTSTVTYTAVDTAGNAAVPVTRTVQVAARAAAGGGGGGAVGLLALPWLAAALFALRRRGRRFTA
jgi:hypothetical protein